MSAGCRPALESTAWLRLPFVVSAESAGLDLGPRRRWRGRALDGSQKPAAEQSVEEEAAGWLAAHEGGELDCSSGAVTQLGSVFCLSRKERKKKVSMLADKLPKSWDQSQGRSDLRAVALILYGGVHPVGMNTCELTVEPRSLCGPVATLAAVLKKGESLKNMTLAAGSLLLILAVTNQMIPTSRA